MEHSVLHALDLIGQVIALGGVLMVLGLIRPALRTMATDAGSGELSRALCDSAGRWVCRGALLAAAATFAGIFVDVAEVKGRTIFDGVNLGLAAKFATQTWVGRLSVARLGALLLTAGVARLSGGYKWWLVGLTTAGGIIVTSLVSHAAAQPTDRSILITTQVAHITGAGIWVGVLIHLLAARSWIQGRTGAAGIRLLAEIVRRFSPIALSVTSLLALSGILMAYRFEGGLGAILVSAYGLTLVVKLLMLMPALFAGAMNYRVIRPALLSFAQGNGAGGSMEESKSALLKQFGRMLELEVTAGVLVIMAAGILASVSPPGEGGAYRLTEVQTHALLSPHLPVTKLADPATFYGAPERTVDDLRFAEFMHNWSGVLVCLLGLSWLAQSLGLNRWAANGWPVLLVPFAAFVAAASDPEIWWLHRLGLRDVIGDPQLLEHQLGAVMLLVLAWLGWRDRKNPPTNRPLGYALPVIMILGGILLLGHAHSTLTITEELTNLINVQHAIFGAFILSAGIVRWLSLRQLMPPRVAGALWPSMIICLGVFMAFFYRETV